MDRRIAHLVERRTAPTADGGYDYTTDLMSTLLGHAGLRLDKVIYWQSAEQAGAELTLYQPHLVVLWEQHGHMLRALSGGAYRSPDDLVGYVWLASAVCPGVKCITTYAPARLRMEWGLTGVVKFHLAKAAREAVTGELMVPTRNIEVALPSRGYTAQDVVNGLGLLRAKKARLAHDLEGGCGMGPACLGFAWSAHEAFVVPIYGVDGESIWSEEEELLIWEAAAALLEDSEVPKIIQNALYELFVLAWTTGIVIHGLTDDTMLKHFELYAELDKSLEFQASIYTSQPYWKLDHKQVEGRYVPFRNGKRVTSEEWFIYNGTDCCVTYEVNEVMERQLKPKQREHYQWNVSLLVPVAYMSLRGIRYDAAEAKRRLEQTQEQIYELQDEINREAATAESREDLRQFFKGFGFTPLRILDQVPDACRSTSVEPENATLGSDVGFNVEAILPLLTSAFCQARRVEQKQVEEIIYEPHHFNGKRWVKKGKRLREPGDWPTFEEAPDPIEYQVWAKPHRKLITRNIPVAVETLEDVRRFAKDSQLDVCKRAIRLIQAASNGAFSPAQRGELATLLGISVKINATNAGGDAQWYLYEHLKLPKQFQKDGNKLTDRLASDDEALIKAYLKSGKDDATRDKRALTFLKMRRLVTQTKFLEAVPDEDGRIRSGMNLVATPTCRMAMYGSPTGTSDLNLQTIGKGLRNLFVADEGCVIGQRDLSNADAYSVAAFCAMLGDETMLLDLRNKIKPANVLARIYEAGPSINQLTREQLREECKKVDGEGWLYFACKRVLHGSNYGMGKQTMANQILTDSFKLLGQPIWLEPRACEEIQEKAFFVRYPGVRRWHDWMARELRDKGVLVASTGFQRRVFGRKDDHNTLKELLAHYPQYFTTRAIKMTLWRQWQDMENRRTDGSLRVEPLLLVHDSNVSQWREEDTEFAKQKLTAWFDNPINVAGLTLVIPASGTYGKDWKNQEEAL